MGLSVPIRVWIPIVVPGASVCCSRPSRGHDTPSVRGQRARRPSRRGDHNVVAAIAITIVTIAFAVAITAAVGGWCAVGAGRISISSFPFPVPFHVNITARSTVPSAHGTARAPRAAWTARHVRGGHRRYRRHRRHRSPPVAFAVPVVVVFAAACWRGWGNVAVRVAGEINRRRRVGKSC